MPVRSTVLATPAIPPPTAGVPNPGPGVTKLLRGVVNSWFSMRLAAWLGSPCWPGIAPAGLADWPKPCPACWPNPEEPPNPCPDDCPKPEELPKPWPCDEPKPCCGLGDGVVPSGDVPGVAVCAGKLNALTGVTPGGMPDGGEDPMPAEYPPCPVT